MFWNLGRKRFEVTVKTPLVFVHVPKSAGTSVHNFLIDSFGKDALAPPRLIHEFHNVPLGYKLYSGHTCLDQWATLPVKPRFVTWLRDPVRRVLSTYYFLAISVRTNPHIEEDFADFHHLSLQEFSEGGHPSYLGPAFNFVAHILGPGVKGTPVRDDDYLLGAARRALAKFAYIGITEKTDRNLFPLARRFRLGLPRVSYRSNVYSDNAKRLELDLIARDPPTPKIVETIQQNNRVDIELYRLARRRNAFMW